jgi:hypothetical protein
MSEGGEKSDYESGSIPKIHQDHVKRKREFKGRHIQMMGTGPIFHSGVDERRRYYWGRSVAAIGEKLVFCWACLRFYCVPYNCYSCALRFGLTQEVAVY